MKNITKTTQTIKVSTEVEEISKLTKEAEKTSKLAKETETTLGATIIESVKAAEQAGEEAKVVSGIDRAKDTLERLKKWEEPGVDELKITKTGETVSKGSKDCNGIYTGGRTEDELQALAMDPSHAFRIEEQGIKERTIGLELEERGDLGFIIRDLQENGGAEFIDLTTGKKWDVKSFESYPHGHTSPRKGAFTVANAMKKINSEISRGHNVILDVRELVDEHVIELKKAITEVGLSDKVIWYP